MVKFTLGGGNRELVNETRMEELVQPYKELFHAGGELLSLRNKSYSREAARVLSTYLVDLGLVPILDLADMIAGRSEEEALEVLEMICNSLSHLKSVVEIDLSDNALGEKGIRKCFGVLKNQENLEKVYFCNNGLSAAAAEVIAKEVLLYRGNNEHTKLKVFEFYNNMSGDLGAIALKEIVLRSPNLEELRFSATRAGRVGSLAFAESLSGLQYLRKLDLSDNTFGVEGGRAIAVALKKQKHLRSLNLRDGAIEDGGIIPICEALECPLEIFDISGNELSEKSMRVVANTIKLFKGLKIFMAEENELTSAGAIVLANAMKEMKQLECIGLNTNEIGGNGAMAIAKSISKQHHVVDLQLNGNSIKEDVVEKIIGHLSSVGKAEVLQEMDDNMPSDDEDEPENGDEMDAVDEDLLVEQFKAMSTTSELRTLCFEENREVVSAERAMELIEPYRTHENNNYHTVCLKNKSYTKDAAKVIAQVLTKVKGIQIADFADMIAGRPEVEALEVLSTICSACSDNQFQEIDLSDNALGEKGVRACFPILKNQHSLERLYFCNNGISAAAAAVIANEVVLDGLQDENTKLETFHFYNNMSGDQGAIELAKILPKSPMLTSLRFSATRAGRAGCSEFASALTSLRNLVHLDLSDNTFGVEGSLKLAQVLQHQSNLTTLNFRDAAIEDDGASAICAVLAKHCPLIKVFDMSGNDLTVECMDKVAECVNALSNLEELYLEENELGCQGSTILATGMAKGCENLKKLVLNVNEISNDGALAIAEEVVKRDSFTMLELDGNELTSDGVETLKSCLRAANKMDILGSLEDNNE